MLILTRGTGKFMLTTVVKKIVFAVDSYHIVREVIYAVYAYHNGREVIFAVDFNERVGKLLMLLILI